MENNRSPSGRFEIQISAWEARMSLWIDTPTLFDHASGEALLVFRDANWSLEAARWDEDAIVALTLRKYPGSHVPAQLTARIDCANRTANVAGRTVALAQFEDLLERSLEWPGEASGASAGPLRGLLDRLLGRS